MAPELFPICPLESRHRESLVARKKQMLIGSFGKNLGKALLYTLAVLLHGFLYGTKSLFQLVACGSENWLGCAHV